jgi:hypothetical protein
VQLVLHLKGVRGNIEQGISPMCSKENSSHIFRCDETKKRWRNDLVDKRFTSVDPEIGIRRAATNQEKDKLNKFGLYLNMYKEKWKRAVIKQEED